MGIDILGLGIDGSADAADALRYLVATKLRGL
jgi:hypothetical protein